MLQKYFYKLKIDLHAPWRIKQPGIIAGPSALKDLQLEPGMPQAPSLPLGQFDVLSSPTTISLSRYQFPSAVPHSALRQAEDIENGPK